jgi:alkylation response protein AidB-like acyl-CoA dehydrogenase
MFNADENDLRFAIRHVVGLDNVTDLAPFADYDADICDAVLSEAAKLATEVIAPINQTGDVGSTWHSDNTVTTPAGFADAFKALGEGGWTGIGTAEEYGGQNMPEILCAATREMWHSANMGLALCHLLTEGLIHALQTSASEEQKQMYVRPMAEGRWTGTMNLTESQAGTDLAAIRTQAVPDGDHYRIKGQKIFITYGEHDMAENIVHMVLARTPDAPAGVKGISVFIVPKFLVNEDGSLGARNDVKCVSIEHKLGINGSPTTVLQYGDDEGAIGYLVGEENQGLNIMFNMMNHARFSVGIEGLAISNRAYYQALAYAQERRQGTPIDRAEGDAIIHHPDVMRLLATMRAEIEAMRPLALYGATALDRGHYDAGESKSNWQTRAELMVPIIKGWMTERSIDIASDGVQVHGGMGFIEETGAAQHLRDARILTIYEGTTAIQANDLMFRKTLRDQGVAVRALIEDIRQDADEVLLAAVAEAETALDHILTGGMSTREASAVSVPYMMMLGTLTGGWMALKNKRAAHAQMDTGNWDKNFLNAKAAHADVFATHSLPRVAALAQTILNGSDAIEAMDASWFDS